MNHEQRSGPPAERFTPLMAACYRGHVQVGGRDQRSLGTGRGVGACVCWWRSGCTRAPEGAAVPHAPPVSPLCIHPSDNRPDGGLVWVRPSQGVRPWSSFLGYRRTGPVRVEEGVNRVTSDCWYQRRCGAVGVSFRWCRQLSQESVRLRGVRGAARRRSCCCGTARTPTGRTAPARACCSGPWTVAPTPCGASLPLVQSTLPTAHLLLQRRKKKDTKRLRRTQPPKVSCS